MAIDSDLKRQARSAFIYKRRNMTQIARDLGVSDQTVRRWKKKAKADGDDWDIARAAHVIAGEGLDATITHVVEEFMLMAQHMIEELKDTDQPLEKRVSQITSLADAMTKMTNSAGKLAPKISELGVAQDVIRRMTEFVRAEFPDHADALLEVIEPFAETLAEAYGS